MSDLAPGVGRGSSTSLPNPGDRQAGWLAAWLALVLVTSFWHLGAHPLIEPDEGRNAEVAREMATAKDYLLPQLNGLPYLDKPVVFFAACAASIELFGVNELAARLPSMLFALATVALVGWYGRRLYGLEAGVVAAIATLTAPLTVAFSRIVIMDTALSFFVALAILGFHAAVEQRRQDVDRVNGGSRLRWPRWLRWTLVSWAAVAFGVLTKGPVALAVPLLVATPYALWRRAARAVWHPLGVLVAASLVAPWVWLVSREVPDFLHYVLVTETASRMTSDELRRSEPIWFFLPVLLAGSLPWFFLAVGALRAPKGAHGACTRPDLVLALLWLVGPLVLFSLSRGKQEQYVLPLVPAVALLAASGWSRGPRGVRPAAACWGVLGLGLAAAAATGLRGLDPDRLAPQLAVWTCAGLGTALLVGAVLAWWSGARRPRLAVIGLSLPMVALPLLAGPAVDAVAESRSAHDLASALAERLVPGTGLLWVDAYAPGLSFYLERAVPLVSNDGRQLRSNYIVRNTDRFLTDSGPLRPLPTSPGSLVTCSHPQVLLIAARHHDLRASLEAGGARLVAQNQRWQALAPDCPGAIDRSPDHGTQGTPAED